MTSSVLLILSTLMVGISIQIPNASAGAKDHNVGNLDILKLTDYGRILSPVNWVVPQTLQDSTSIGFIGLVIDHDNYDHTPGAEDIADSYITPPPYMNYDDFEPVKDITMIIDNATTQKSFASFQNKGAGYPDDILINQTAWTLLNKDWAILQWTLSNVKSPASDLTNVHIGLEVPISKEGGRYGLGGLLVDSGDDVDGYDPTNDIYWAQDTSDGTTIGFASAAVSDPITHYYAEDYHADYSSEYKNFFANDTWLYQRLQAPSATATDGVTPGNITATVGWDGFDILAGESRTVALVIAINNSFNNMIAALKDAQNYYRYVVTGFRITEFSDSSSGTQQIEVFNYGHEPTDLTADGYFLSVDGGINSLSGTWVNNPLPTYEYAVFTLNPGEIIGAEGDTIGLYQNIGGGKKVLADEISFGQEGVAPDPLIGESVARRYDASMAEYTNEWLRNASTGPTWGSQNDVGSFVTIPRVVLNRVMFNPTYAVEGYVELLGIGSLDISNYKIVCDNEFIVPSITVLNSTNRYYVLKQADMPSFFTDMNAAGDNVYLYDDNDNLLDMVGWSSSHNQGEFMSRIRYGSGTNQGYDDTTSQTVGWVFDQLPSMMITEFYVDSSMAQIEAYNPRGGDIVPDTRWRFTVDSGTLTGTWSPDPIPDGGYSNFTMTGGNPGNEGDTIRLYYTGSITDEISFGIKGIAPDPLLGESTARYWVDPRRGYTNDWTRAPTSTFGAQNDVPAINPNPYVVLNDVMFNPSFVPNGKYIVIINKDGFTINISNYYLVCDDYYKLPSIEMPPFTMHLINYTNAPSMFNSMNPIGDNVYLYDNNGQLLDIVGWNTPHTQGMSVRRVPDGAGTYQGYNDTTSKAAGWVFNSPLQVQMTEISDDGSMQAQIEVYNPWYPLIDFSTNFTFESDSTPSGPLTGAWWIQTANSGEHAVFNVTAGLDSEGDTISFYQNGAVIEEISYGQKGTIPDPLPNESVERHWDGSAYTNLWERNWTSGPNFGAKNDVPPPNLSSTVVLNEIMFNPSASEDRIVELYLKLNTILNISGYKIVGDTEYIIPDGMELTPDYRFYYLIQPMDTAFFAVLNSSGDNVYLYDDNGSLLDMVGWSSAHDVNKSMGRLPDGGGTAYGFNDTTSEAAGWMFNQFPTYAVVRIMEDQVKWGDPGYSVWYPLNITNFQTSADHIDVIVQSENGWPVELYEADQSTLLVDKESPPDGLPDTGLLAPKIKYQIWAKIYIPFPPGAGGEKTKVFAQASSVNFSGKKVLLMTLANPRVEPDIYIEDPPYPTTIYEKSAGLLGLTNETTITLNATGMRYLQDPIQDVIFILDSSGSMGPGPWGPGNDPDPDGIPGNIPFPQRVQASWDYVDNLTGWDRGGYVDFDSTATLRVPLTTDYFYLKQDTFNGLWCSDQDGGTIINPALSVANQELINNGDPNRIRVEILITDAGAITADDDFLSRREADIAADAGIIIFTIGLNVSVSGPPGGVNLLNYIAGVTGGQYFPAPNASALTTIFSQISSMVNNIAGYNPNPGVEEVIVRFVLEQSIDYIDGTFQLVPGTIENDPNPDTVTFNPTNTTLEWNWVADQIRVGESWAVRFNISSTVLGANVPINIVPDSSVFYMTVDNIFVTKDFPLVTIKVLPKPTTGPRITNVTIEPGGVNITWSPVIGAESYEIYGGPSQTALNLDLTDVLDTVSAPQIWWLDTIKLPVYDEYYYVVRAVDTDTMPETRSQTSNTGGYYTKQFGVGLNTFSLPLEPFANFYTDYYTTIMNADYIKYMDTVTHTWLKHSFGDGNSNNIEMKLGEAYEVKFSSKTTYTFTGMPGAMIHYDNISFGFDATPLTGNADSLTATVDSGGNTTLNWTQPANMGSEDRYYVLRSTSRDGFWGTLGLNYTQLAVLPFDVLSYQDIGNATAGTEYYYMILPVNSSTGKRGVSSYSIGVWTAGYLDQYDTFAVPLRLSSNQTADWYCDNIPETVGINYFIHSQQRWGWHSTRMPAGAYDPMLEMAGGYQISTSGPTKFTFIGV